MILFFNLCDLHVTENQELTKQQREKKIHYLYFLIPYTEKGKNPLRLE